MASITDIIYIVGNFIVSLITKQEDDQAVEEEILHLIRSLEDQLARRRLK